MAHEKFYQLKKLEKVGGGPKNGSKRSKFRKIRIICILKLKIHKKYKIGVFQNNADIISYDQLKKNWEKHRHTPKLGQNW